MRQRRRWTISETEYPAIRMVMGPERYRLDDDQLEDRLAELFPDAEPDDVENFMRAVQSFGTQVAPLAQRALPGAMRGAAQGAMVAGPWGALAGAVGGGAASLLTGPPARPPAAAALAGGPRAAAPPATPPAPAMVPEPAAPSNAPAAQLMALLSRPETLQALLSMLMAGSGRGAVRVGAQSVPPAAFANAVSELAAEAIERAAPSPAGGISDYLVDESGSPRCDVANPRARAALLVGDVAALAASEAAEDEEWETDEWNEGSGDLEGGPMDAYEAALQGRRH